MTSEIERRLTLAGVAPEAAKAAEKALSASGGEGRWFDHKVDGPTTLVGTVSGDRWTKPNQFGSTDYGLAIATEEGTVRVCTYWKAWKTELDRENPRPGDVVVFEYRGMKTPKSGGKDYHDVALKVAQRAAVDEKSLGEAPF